MAVFSKDRELERVFGISLSGQGWPMYAISIPEEEGKAPYGLVINSEGEAVKMWGRSEVGGAWERYRSQVGGFGRGVRWEGLGRGVRWEGLGRSQVGGAWERSQVGGA